LRKITQFINKVKFDKKSNLMQLR